MHGNSKNETMNKFRRWNAIIIKWNNMNKFTVIQAIGIAILKMKQNWINSDDELQF